METQFLEAIEIAEFSEDLCEAMDGIVVREGMAQRGVSSGMAARVNEIEQHRDFSENHFLGVAPKRDNIQHIARLSYEGRICCIKQQFFSIMGAT